jgi:hypothetical protein
MELMTEDDARERVRGYMRGREWWVIPYVTEWGAVIGDEVERRYYDGEANADFHLMLWGPASIAFAHKRHMNERQYASLLAEITSESVADWASRLRERDVVFAGEEHEHDACVALCVLLDAWMGPLDSP